jgi:hypothetical protein
MAWSRVKSFSFSSPSLGDWLKFYGKKALENPSQGTLNKINVELKKYFAVH